MPSDRRNSANADAATLRFPVTAGRFIRGDVRRAIKQAAWAQGCEVEIEEDRGFWESAMRFTITGPSESIRRLTPALMSWIQEHNDA